MRPLTADHPKALLPVGRETVLNRLVRQIACHTSLDRIRVVTGYRPRSISEALMVTFGEHVRTIENPAYASDTNIQSLCLGIEGLETGYTVVEADAVYEDACFDRIFHADLSNHSVWFTSGRFTPHQVGGIVGVEPDGRVRDLAIVPCFEPRYAEHFKMAGVLKVGHQQAPTYRSLLEAAGPCQRL